MKILRAAPRREGRDKGREVEVRGGEGLFPVHPHGYTCTIKERLLCYTIQLCTLVFVLRRTIAGCITTFTCFKIQGANDHQNSILSYCNNRQQKVQM